MSEPLRGPAAVFEQMWQSSEKECAELRAEIERLTEERDQFIEQIANRQPSVVERDMQEIMKINNELLAEIERLRALLDRHHKWQLRCGPRREYCEAALYDETRKALEEK